MSEGLDTYRMSNQERNIGAKSSWQRKPKPFEALDDKGKKLIWNQRTLVYERRQGTKDEGCTKGNRDDAYTSVQTIV